MLEATVVTQARDGGAVELVVEAVERLKYGLVLEIYEGRAKPVF